MHKVYVESPGVMRSFEITPTLEVKLPTHKFAKIFCESYCEDQALFLVELACCFKDNFGEGMTNCAGILQIQFIAQAINRLSQQPREATKWFLEELLARLV